MANLPTESEGRAPSPLRDIHPFFGVVGRLDDVVFAAEKALITAMLAIMTIAVTLKIVNDSIDKQLVVLQSDAPSGAIINLGVLGLVFFTAFAVAAAKTERFTGKTGVQLGVAAVATVGTAFYFYGISVWSPSVVCAVTTLISAATVITSIVRTGKEEGTTGSPAQIAMLAFVVVLHALIIFMTRNYESYSWASDISLTLLMWMAFFGASMATYDHRHLSIDAVKKAVPTKYTRLFSALSFFLTAAATAALLILAWNYFVLRLDDAGMPGRIPSSWRVLSIPFCLLLMTIRFSSYGAAELLLQLRGVPPAEPPSAEPSAEDGDVAAPVDAELEGEVA